MNAREREILLEAAGTAHRERDRDGRLVPPPAWWDLPAKAKEELFELQVVSRKLEQIANPSGASTTVTAVMARILGLV